MLFRLTFNEEDRLGSGRLKEEQKLKASTVIGRWMSLAFFIFLLA